MGSKRMSLSSPNVSSPLKKIEFDTSNLTCGQKSFEEMKIFKLIELIIQHEAYKINWTMVHTNSHDYKHHTSFYIKNFISSSWFYYLYRGSSTGDFSEVLSLLQEVPISLLKEHLIIVKLLSTIENEKDIGALVIFMDFVEVESATNRNLDFLNILLEMFLDLFGKFLIVIPELKIRAARLKTLLET